MSSLFLLSPAHCGGERARILLRPEAGFDLAIRLREHGATLGETFAFLSGLYFRGKLAYAQAFSPAPGLVITPNRGLVPADATVTRETLLEYGQVDIHEADPRYRRPLLRDARLVAAQLPEHRVVLLGSVASAKYVDVLLEVFGARLLFPQDFVGRGDMSRGGLLLRAARAGVELPYAPVKGAVLHGKRPPKLPREKPGYLNELARAAGLPETHAHRKARGRRA